MPGHNSARGFPFWLKSNLANLDVTELPGTDDLNRPFAAAREAMELAAGAFGSGHTRFITSGSTTAIQIMLACAVGHGAKILVSRCCHQSVISAAAILDLDIVWYCQSETEDFSNGKIRAEKKRFSLLYQPGAKGLEAYLQQNPDCRAVLITSPDYYGECANLYQIAQLAHKYKVLLLVDEAHGSHFVFNQDEMPVSALAAGADMCVHSGHKTLPVLTPGAWIHISEKAVQERKIDLERLQSLIPVFQTSSPSFAIAATLDYARAFMQKSGHRLIAEQVEQISRINGRLSNELLASSHERNADNFERDPLRVIITSRNDDSIIPARVLEKYLTESGYNIEFADLTRLVLLPSLFKPKKEWHLLLKKINQIGAKIQPDTSGRLLNLENLWRKCLMRQPEPAMSLRESLFDLKRIVYRPLAQAEGCMLARLIAPYPPGIPLFFPGEIIDAKKLDFLRLLIENGINTAGIDQGKIPVIS